MGKTIDRLNDAANYANGRRDGRSFLIAALGVRTDGPVIRSRNCYVNEPYPEVHAEFRLSKKLNFNSLVYVARVLKDGSGWGLAKPCPSCMRILSYRGVKRVYYTISNGEYGTIDMRHVTFPTNPTGRRIPIKQLGRWNRGATAYSSLT